MLEGGDVERMDGDEDRLEDGTLTAMESLVAMEEVDPGPVRRAKAARRGRGTAVELLLLGLTAGEALLLIRAASWLREGRRLGFGRLSVVEVIVVDGKETLDTAHNAKHGHHH
jgi:hypothetical protein